MACTAALRGALRRVLGRPADRMHSPTRRGAMSAAIALDEAPYPADGPCASAAIPRAKSSGVITGMKSRRAPSS